MADHDTRDELVRATFILPRSLLAALNTRASMQSGAAPIRANRSLLARRILANHLADTRCPLCGAQAEEEDAIAV